MMRVAALSKMVESGWWYKIQPLHFQLHTLSKYLCPGQYTVAVHCHIFDHIHTNVLSTEINWMVDFYADYPQLRPANWQYSDRSVLSSVLPTQYWYQKKCSEIVNVLHCFVLITMTMKCYYNYYYDYCFIHNYPKVFRRNWKKKFQEHKILEFFHTFEKRLQF